MSPVQLVDEAEEPDVAIVWVTPLQPPFRGEVAFLSFSGEETPPLAVSNDDARRLEMAFGPISEGRRISLQPAPDGKIGVSVVPS